MIQLLALVAALNGTWSIAPSPNAGEVHLTLTAYGTAGTSLNQDGSDVSVTSLGLSRQDLTAPGHHVTFTIARDAGDFQCDGWIDKGRGGGTLTFSPSPAYRSEMGSLGYHVTPEQQLGAAMLDVSFAYAKEMTSLGLGKIEFHNLMAFRALGIDPQYVRDLASVGYIHLTSRQVVELRALKIDAAYIRKVEAHGYDHPPVGDLVRLKAMNII
jgi:hypothetical protein